MAAKTSARQDVSELCRGRDQLAAHSVAKSGKRSEGRVNDRRTERWTMNGCQ